MEILSVFAVVIGLGLLVFLLALCSKYLDSETYAMVRAKILALEIWAEFNFTGKKCGDERMNEVEKLVKDNFSSKELTLLEQKGGIREFAECVLPIARKIFVWVIKTGKVGK